MLTFSRGGPHTAQSIESGLGLGKGRIKLWVNRKGWKKSGRLSACAVRPTRRTFWPVGYAVRRSPALFVSLCSSADDATTSIIFLSRIGTGKGSNNSRRQ